MEPPIPASSRLILRSPCPISGKAGRWYESGGHHMDCGKDRLDFPPYVPVCSTIISHPPALADLWFTTCIRACGCLWPPSILLMGMTPHHLGVPALTFPMEWDRHVPRSSKALWPTSRSLRAASKSRPHSVRCASAARPFFRRKIRSRGAQEVQRKGLSCARSGVSGRRTHSCVVQHTGRQS